MMGVVSYGGCGQLWWVWSVVVGVVSYDGCGQLWWVWLVMGVVSYHGCGLMRTSTCTVWLSGTVQRD